MEQQTNTDQKLTWPVRIAMLGNHQIRRQALTSFGLPALLIVIAMWLLSDNALFIRVGIALLGFLLALHVLFFATIYRWNYQAIFSVDAIGVHGKLLNPVPQAMWFGRLVGSVIGLFSGKFIYVGAGLLIPGQPEYMIEWQRVTRINFNPTSRTIVVYSGLVNRLLLVCTEENYSDIVELIDAFHA